MSKFITDKVLYSHMTRPNSCLECSAKTSYDAGVTYYCGIKGTLVVNKLEVLSNCPLFK